MSLPKKNNIGYIIEKSIVFISILLSVIILMYTAPLKIKIYNFDLIASSLITIAATFIGIIVTTLTLLIALLDSKAIKHIFEIERWNLFIKYFSSPILIGLLLILFVLFLLFKIEFKGVVYLDKILFIIAFSLCISFLVSLFRLSLIFIELLKSIQYEKISKKDDDDELDLTKLKNTKKSE